MMNQEGSELATAGVAAIDNKPIVMPKVRVDASRVSFFIDIRVPVVKERAYLGLEKSRHQPDEPQIHTGESIASIRGSGPSQAWPMTLCRMPVVGYRKGKVLG